MIHHLLRMGLSIIIGLVVVSRAAAAGLAPSSSQPTTQTSQPANENVVIDFSKVVGKLRPLHGVVNGPADWGGTTDVSAFDKEAGVPFISLNAPHWYSPDVVDIHCIYPNFDADPDDPKSYYFAKTDDYVQSVLNTGARIAYRLGESIEHLPRYHIDPPKDFNKWARICVNIIRHYNKGWANGFRHNIEYWQIWNEPDIGPQQWRGTPQQYFDLYRVTATAIKAHDPAVKVGGPAAYSVHSEMVRPFLAYCRDHKLPLDFFVWHGYVNSPQAVADAATQARAILDEYGFKETENHLTEWHYLKYPFTLLHTRDPRLYPQVEKAFNEMAGPEGAAFSASLLLMLQDRPVDQTFYYSGDTDRYGLFDHFGVPHKTYYSFRAFNELLKTPNRVSCQGVPMDDGLAMCAGVGDGGKAAALMVSSFQGPPRTVVVSLQNLPWSGPAQVRVYVVDEQHDFDVIWQDRFETKGLALKVELSPRSVCYISLTPP